MKLAEKLNSYFKENGVEQKWFAENIGVTPTYFYQMSKGYKKIKPIYWAAIVELTRGYITLADLAEDYYKDIPGLGTERKNSKSIYEVIVKINKKMK